jgi:ankyrin repeat protein
VNRRKDVVKLLLNNGPAIVIENKSGWTAVQLSALNRYEGVARRLLWASKASFVE